ADPLDRLERPALELSVALGEAYELQRDQDAAGRFGLPDLAESAAAEVLDQPVPRYGIVARVEPPVAPVSTAGHPRPGGTQRRRFLVTGVANWEEGRGPTRFSGLRPGEDGRDQGTPVGEPQEVLRRGRSLATAAPPFQLGAQ